MDPTPHFQEMDNPSHHLGNTTPRHLCSKASERQGVQKEPGTPKAQADPGGGTSHPAGGPVTNTTGGKATRRTRGGTEPNGAPAARTASPGQVQMRTQQKQLKSFQGTISSKQRQTIYGEVICFSQTNIFLPLGKCSENHKSRNNSVK